MSWTAKLYTRNIPPVIRRYYAKLEREAEAKRRKRFAKEWRNLEEILNDPKSTEQEKRLARIELLPMDEEMKKRARA